MGKKITIYSKFVKEMRRLGIPEGSERFEKNQQALTDLIKEIRERELEIREHFGRKMAEEEVAKKIYSMDLNNFRSLYFAPFERKGPRWYVSMGNVDINDLRNSELFGHE